MCLVTISVMSKVVSLLTVGFALLVACSGPGVQLPSRNADGMPIAVATPTVIEAGRVPDEEDLVLLDECDKIDSSQLNGRKSFRKNLPREESVAIRICVGFNEGRNRILRLEKMGDSVRVDFWAKRHGTPIHRSLENGELDNVWSWIESRNVLNTPVSTIDCITQPALDSEIVIIEIWNAGKHWFRVTSPDCSELSDARGDSARFAKDVSTRIGVPLL